MLVNYSQLKAHYDAVKPIRGDANKTKPFFDRRNKRDHMVMLGNGDIQIICYKTPVITVHPDSSFSLCHGGYITQTTANFTNFVIRTMGWLGRGGIYKLNNNLWLRQTGTRGYESTYPILTDPIRLVYDESSDTYEPKEVVTYTEQRLRVDKDKSKQARTECKQFLMWLKAIAPVMEGSKVQYVPPESPQKDRIRHICTHPADINKIRDMNKHLTNVNELPLKNYVAAIQELKHMLTCGDDAEFLEFLHYVTGGKVFNKKTLLARVNRIMNHIFDVYYVEQVEIKAGSGNT